MLHDPRNINAIAQTSILPRSLQIESVFDRLPRHLRPSPGSFHDRFARACTEVALSAHVDERGVATVSRAAVLPLARLLCGRSLSAGYCHGPCHMQRQCVASSKLVLASFGAQARYCIALLGLQVEAN